MKKSLLLFTVLIILVSLFIVGCNKKPKKEIYVYNWSEYLTDELIREFEKESGVRVRYTTYDSNEMMYSKLKLQSGAGYDLIFPSSYYVKKLATEGLLQEIDHSKLTGLDNMNPQLMNLDSDMGNKYSIPYLWGSSILLYNTKYIKEGEVKGWKDLWNPKYKGHVLLNNDLREVFQMTLMTLGYDGNSADEGEIIEAYNELMKLLPSVRVFNSDSPKQPFINEEVRIGLIWGGESYMAQQENANLAYVYPEEGAILWMDSVSIPKGAINVEYAYDFINFLLRPDVAMRISTEIGYTSPNLAAMNMLPPELKANELLNPTEENLKGAQFQNDVGSAILIYNKYWERLKTGQ